MDVINPILRLKENIHITIIPLFLLAITRHILLVIAKPIFILQTRIFSSILNLRILRPVRALFYEKRQCIKKIGDRLSSVLVVTPLPCMHKYTYL